MASRVGMSVAAFGHTQLVLPAPCGLLLAVADPAEWVDQGGSAAASSCKLVRCGPASCRSGKCCVHACMYDGRGLTCTYNMVELS